MCLTLQIDHNLLTTLQKIESKIVPVHALKAYGGVGV